MKKSVKKCLTALVAIPVAAALLTGCGKTEVKPAFDSDPYAMPDRAYSTETSVATDVAFGSTIAQPVLDANSTAAVSSVSNSKDGVTTIVMQGVSENEYNNYKTTYDPDTDPAPVSTGTGDYSVEWEDDDEDGFGTMVIEYDAGVAADAPSTFKTVNLAANSENIYFKMVFDSSWVYNTVVDTVIEEAEMGGMELSRQDAIDQLKLMGVTEETCGMAVELGIKGDDMAMAIYSTSTVELNMHIAMIGNTMYTTMSMPMPDMETGEVVTMNVWYKTAAEGSVDSGLTDTDEAMGVVGGIGSDYASMLEQYMSSGYETINGNVYYYEEFVVPADPEAGETEDSVVRYYFNGNDLIYAESDGARMEIVVSNKVPSRLFRTECPTGYLDVSEDMAM